MFDKNIHYTTLFSITEILNAESDELLFIRKTITGRILYVTVSIHSIRNRFMAQIGKMLQSHLMNYEVLQMIKRVEYEYYQDFGQKILSYKNS